MTNPNIKIATLDDAEAIQELLNSAYRGALSMQGWTSEAHLITGNSRTDIAEVCEIIQRPASVFLLHTNEKKELVGCVNLQRHGTRMYLGMFCVKPALQGKGLGKQLLQVGEDYATGQHCSSIYMSVISLRSELIKWYNRCGYVDSRERRPFVEDARSGHHLKPLEFMTLEKFISRA